MERNQPADRGHQLRSLWLADRKTPQCPARRGRGAPEPVQPSPAGALERQRPAPERAARRSTPHRLRRPPLAGRRRRRAADPRKPPRHAPAGRRRAAVDAGDDGQHGHLARVQRRPEPGAGQHPALGQPVSHHTHRLLLLRPVLPRRAARPAHPSPEHGRLGVTGHRRRLCGGHLVHGHGPWRAVFRCGGHVRPVPAQRSLPGAPRPGAHRSGYRATGQVAAGLLPAPG